MMLERQPKRYSAYFRGWCQTFGEHESIPGKYSDIRWLFTGQQVGFILPQTLTRKLYREVLLNELAQPLTFSRNVVTIGELQFDLPAHHTRETLNAIETILGLESDLHVYLTSHLMYGTSARIMTMSAKKPLPIIYKEVGTIMIRLA